MITSCINEEPDIPLDEFSKNKETVLVKNWFNDNKTTLRLPMGGTNFRTESQELILPFFEKEPDWNKFHHYYFPDGREVFEINLDNDEFYIPSSSEDENTLKNGAIQNIMFVKDPLEECFDPLIVRYFPDDASSARDFNDLYYLAIDEKWSGWIDLFSYDEHHLIGFRIDQGTKVSSRTLSQESQLGSESSSSAKMVYECTETITDWYQITTVAGSSSSLEYLDTTFSKECEWVDMGGGPTGDGVVGGGGGSSPSGPNPYIPPVIPAPKLIIEIDLTVAKHPRVNCIVGKLQMSDFVQGIASFVKTGDLTRNSVIKLGSLGINGPNGHTKMKSGGIIEITINRDNLDKRSDLVIARTILHELTHAEIYAALKANGETALDGDFGKNFDKFINVFYGSDDFNLGGDQHHRYMAENLMGKMSEALMNIHNYQFPQDYQSLNDLVKRNGDYPNGVTVEFYKNIFWSGFKDTFAFAQMEEIKTNFPISSPYEKFARDQYTSTLLTKTCGN
ncbi:hypothetical protein [Algoriphagus yeomjeoni]|nr:hypothetical protein [Algoriphagus yeomjeoni]